MKILLVGEYSGLHNSLKEGLLALGNEVTLISSGDYFKKYPSDIKLTRRYDSWLGTKLKVLYYKLFNVDINSTYLYKQFNFHSEKLKGYDVVQLINENPLTMHPKEAKKIIQFLKDNNKKLFLLSCGTDYISVNHALSDAHPYSILHGYKNGTVPKEKYKHIFTYTSTPYKELHDFVYDRIDGVIASDMDYHLPLKDHPKYLGLAPNPVVLDKLIIPKIPISYPIIIFMGVNRFNAHTKGINYFEKALKLVKNKFDDKVKIIRAENLPYDEYINSYNSAHILLDQVLAYDQGYNALEAMAKGKVVFTGAEKEFEAYYNLKEPVAINALPDATKIADKLEKLILNPEMIKQIGENAKAFIKKHHDHVDVAEKYLEFWN